MTIELTDTDAKLFLEFQKNYDAFHALDTAGVFKICNGSVEIHFDSEGTLANITRHEIVYKRKNLHN